MTKPSSKPATKPDSSLNPVPDQAPRPPVGTGLDLNTAHSHKGGEKVDHGAKPLISKNKGGRPKGAKNRTTLLSEAIRNDFTKLAKQRSRKVFEKLTEEAMAGEPWAVKLFMDKIIPNAVTEEDKVKGDFGINIVISDMKSVEITEKEPLEGEFEAKS